MDLKKIEINKDNFKPKKIFSRFLDFILKRFGFIFMVIFITASLISGVIIYKYIFNPDWSDNRRNEYKVELKSTKAPFNEGKFDKIIMKIRERNSSKDSQLLIPRDLFEGDLE